ncbi:MAG: ABC transporter permease, partial [Acidobacteriota bacterium]
MQSFIRDFRLALRALFKNPGFTLVAVLTLALGIGANTAVFSVIHTVLLRPLPYDQPEQLTLIWTNFGPDLPQNWISGPEFVEMREFNSTFEDIGVVVPFTVSVTGDGDPEQVGAAAASANFFNLLRVKPAAGRLFVAGDDEPGAGLVAVLGYGFWQRRYGGDPSVVGRKIQVNGLPFDVVGVLPPDFAILHPDAQFPPSVDIWAPVTSTFGAIFGVDDYSRMPRGNHGLRGFGRLKPGLTPQQAQADMTAVASRMQEKSPDYYDFEGWGITVLSLHDDLVEEYRPALLVLMTAVGLVLLIACVNVANLMLARAASRQREIALRRALGAGRGQLIGHVLTESVTLSAIGGLAGLVLAVLLVRAVGLFAPAGLPRGDEIAIDGRVLLFTLGVALFTGVLFGLAPVFYGLRENLVESLKEGARGSSMGLGGRRFRSGLVVAEVALALVLLVGAGLMIRTFSNLLQSDPGYRSENILTLRVALPQAKYSTPQQINGFFDRLLQQVNALPGVRSTGAISQLPLAGGAMSGTTRVENSQTVPQDQQAGEVDRRVVTPDYFKTMGIQVTLGRAFTPRDSADSLLVAMVDEQFLKRFWPGEEPIGKRISINSNQDGRVWREVVGVVAHSKHANLSRVGREQAYF